MKTYMSGGDMPRKPLTAIQVTSIKKPGFHRDGLTVGLYLQVAPSTHGVTRSWAYRYNSPLTGKLRWLGLGSVGVLSLADARKLAQDYRRIVKVERRDPVDERRATKEAAVVAKLHAMTFKDAALQFLGTAKIENLKSDKHRAQWRSTLEQYAFPVFGNLPLQQIDSAIVLKAILPVLKRTPETGTRVRGRIERVFEWAKPLGLFKGDNPASRAALKDHLPAKRKAKHHPALAYAELPAFMAALDEREGVSARALEFLILTAMRVGEVTGAKWKEIDFGAKVWVVPAERMKASREHRVPLSDRAVALLQALPRKTEFIFVNGDSLPLSNMAMPKLLEGMKVQSTTPGKLATVHGFRSTFRTWADERTAYDHHTKETALAHVTHQTKVEQAYNRSDAFDKRRRLMTEWARFASTTAVTAEVVSLRA
jgi:integrase